ncbi:leucine-rich repeat-containing protein C10orf11-like [Silurus meridionalis]|nr:leucine-rich repeat-containing protein C10orf11-like [Silurus meridionalis]
MAHTESGVVVNGTQVSYIGHDCELIPEFLAANYGSSAKRLDLSFNQLSKQWYLRYCFVNADILVTPLKLFPLAAFGFVRTVIFYVWGQRVFIAHLITGFKKRLAVEDEEEEEDEEVPGYSPEHALYRQTASTAPTQAALV